MRRALLIASLLCALPAPRARAYNEAVHASLTRRAFAGRTGWLAERLAAPDVAQLKSFRARFWLLASHSRDQSLRQEFLARFPSADALDAWSFKELLMLNPAATVHGFDATFDDVESPRGALLPRASRWPDDDRRNRDRLQRDERRQPVRDAEGEVRPFDPATLSLGAIQGPSSQGHAHYGLLLGPLSDDPAVLKNDPRHFAIPKDAQSWGAQFAQLYTDLALVAHGSALPARGWLEASFEGASLHHLEDVSNQIHTIQVGIFEFFEAAFWQSKLRDVETLGGLFGRRATLEQLGLHLISNHHLLLEDLFAKRLLEEEQGRTVDPALREALEGLGRDEPSFAEPARAAMAAARSKSLGEIEALAYVLIDQSSLEGPDCYRLIWGLSVPELRDGLGYAYDGAKGDDPDNFVLASGAFGRAELERFYGLESLGVHRATTAARLWQESFDAEALDTGADERAVERILRLVLPYHREAAARRASWHSVHETLGVAWGYPLAALLLPLGALLLFVRFSKRGDEPVR